MFHRFIYGFATFVLLFSLCLSVAFLKSEVNDWVTYGLSLFWFLLSVIGIIIFIALLCSNQEEGIDGH